MKIHWRANHKDLAVFHKNIGSAYVSDHWQGGYKFHAYPHQGDWTIESERCDDLSDLIERADNWLAGRSDVEGFYSASLC